MRALKYVIIASVVACTSLTRADAGQCTDLVISMIGGRLQGEPANSTENGGFDTGVSIAYAIPNTGYVQAYGVSYQTVPAMKGTMVGDRVRVCRVSTPTDCPVGDNRGSVYSAFDFRTRRKWSLPDSEHMCGGA
jgi:hypothetical protein